MNRIPCAQHGILNCDRCFTILPYGSLMTRRDACFASVIGAECERPDAPGYPDDNPKTAVGATKVPLHLVPPSAKHVLAEAMADGAKKYGPYNWRTKRVSATTYIAASLRHIEAYLDGEDVAPDSLVHHIGHGMACLAILYDALTIGMLNDDRPTRGASPRLQVEYAERNAKVTKAEIPGYGPIDLSMGPPYHTPNYPRTDTGD